MTWTYLEEQLEQLGDQMRALTNQVEMDPPGSPAGEAHLRLLGRLDLVEAALRHVRDHCLLSSVDAGEDLPHDPAKEPA